MLIKKPADIASSEITPRNVYLNRRSFLVGAVAAGAAAAGPSLYNRLSSPVIAQASAKIDGIQKSKFSTSESVTPYKDVTNYNNYYEFSTDKYAPAGLAKDFKTRPWTVSIEGLVKKRQTLDVDSIIKLAAPEERIYRHRCVEGWSIVSAMDRLPVERPHQPGRAGAESQVREVHHDLRPKADAGAKGICVVVALRGRFAYG